MQSALQDYIEVGVMRIIDSLYSQKCCYYAQVRDLKESYYAQNYAGIMDRGINFDDIDSQLTYATSVQLQLANQ